MVHEGGMILSEVFEKFVESSPVAVMARAMMERALEPKALDALRPTLSFWLRCFSSWQTSCW